MWAMTEKFKDKLPPGIFPLSNIPGLPNFVVGWVDEDLVRDSFDENAICLPQTTTMEELFVINGIFPSKGQSRKNGISGPIPFGVNLMGSKRRRFYVWRGLDIPVTPEENALVEIIKQKFL